MDYYCYCSRLFKFLVVTLHIIETLWKASKLVFDYVCALFISWISQRFFSSVCFRRIFSSFKSLKSLAGMKFEFEFELGVGVTLHSFIYLFFLNYSFSILFLICNNRCNNNNKIWGLGRGEITCFLFILFCHYLFVCVLENLLIECNCLIMIFFCFDFRFAGVYIYIKDQKVSVLVVYF